MIAYLYDNNNYYSGMIALQESPLEPGVYFEQPNSTLIPPPQIEANKVQYWNGGSWEWKSNYSETIFYNKITREQKTYGIGELPDLQIYTEVQPLQNESHQKWDEDSLFWIIDIEAKQKIEADARRGNIQRLLLETDYIELPSFIQRKGEETYNNFVKYRETLRNAFKDLTISIPEMP